MPRERVKHGQLYMHSPSPEPGMDIKVVEYLGGDVPPDSTIHEQPSLDVVWNREGGWVQVAFEAPREWWDQLAETYDQDHSPGLHSWSAYTDVLSRQEINHMIRTLRRARDVAYGADE